MKTIKHKFNVKLIHSGSVMKLSGNHEAHMVNGSLHFASATVRVIKVDKDELLKEKLSNGETTIQCVIVDKYRPYDKNRIYHRDDMRYIPTSLIVDIIRY